MKRIVVILMFIFAFSAISAQANWISNFYKTYTGKGIDYAVGDALKEGKSPEEIVKIGIIIDGLSSQELIRALYCEGAKGDDIRAAAKKFDISEKTLVTGYKKNIDECYKKTSESISKTYSSVYAGRNLPNVSPSKFKE